MRTAGRETQRLAELEASRTLDSGPEQVFDRITRLAAQFFSCPIAVVSLVGLDRVSFKSCTGLSCDGVPRDGWFCAHTILGSEPLVVPDVTHDPRFASLPSVCGVPRIRFYAGAPLIVQGSCAVGTLAVMDTRPRDPLSVPELEALRDFTALVTDELDRRIGGNDRPGTLSESLDCIARALPAMVWVTDTEGNCTLLNRFEWDDAGAVARTHHGPDWLNIIQRDEQETEDKADLTCECRIPGPNGEDRWILEQARPRFLADGSFAGYIGLCMDITDRKRTEEALRETQQWLSLAQSAAGIGFWNWDIVHDTSACSEQYFRLYGLELHASFSYADWTRHVHPDDRMSQAEFLKRIQPGKDDVQHEFRCVWPDGSIHWLHSRARLYRDESGRPVRALGANFDISGFKEAEERRNQADRELLASRQQLRQLAAHVESAREQERTRIAREIHDELGQILTVLKMDLEAVESRYRSSVARPLKDVTRRITAMVKNLDFMIGSVNRIATELRPGILDHLGIAAAIEWQLHDLETRTGIRCQVIGLPDKLPLDGHRSTAVFRVIQEILTNVARHARATCVKMSVDLDAAGLRLTVTDNGRGFDPHRLPNPAALGLLGMRERALLLGGSLTLESQPGKGTTVTLKIPVSSSPRVAPQSAG